MKSSRLQQALDPQSPLGNDEREFVISNALDPAVALLQPIAAGMDNSDLTSEEREAVAVVLENIKRLQKEATRAYDEETLRLCTAHERGEG